MAVVPTPIFPQAPKNGKAQISTADGTSLKTVYTADTDGSKLTAMSAASTDSAAKVLEWGVENGGTFYQMGAINLPIDAGTASSVPAVNIFNSVSNPGLPIDNDGSPYVLLISGDTLRVRVQATVSSSESALIHVVAIGADF